MLEFSKRFKAFFFHKKAKTFYHLLAFGTFGYSTVLCVNSYFAYKFKKHTTIPTQVIEREKTQSDIIISLPQLEDSSVWLNLWKRDTLSPQKLLEEASSSNKKLRIAATQKIANHLNWNAADCQTIAQSLHSSSLIGLARHKTTDLRLFLPPPPLPKVEGDLAVEKLLYTLLSKLPQNDTERCLQFYTTDALSNSDEYRMSKESQRSGAWDNSVEQEVDYHSEESALQSAQNILLLALVKHSEIEDHCEIMIKEGILQILQYIHQLHPNLLQLQKYVFRIISNICIYRQFHSSILQSGWVTLLVQTARHSDISIFMQASRALANLDRDAVDGKFADGLFQLYPRHRDQSQDFVADVIFVHGMLGGAFRTWRQRDDIVSNRTDCWPESWLSRDLDDCRILSVEYDTSLSDWRSICPFEPEKRTIEYRSRQILEKNLLAGVGSRPIIWMAHSMGGLIVKQMLKEAKENPKKFGDINRNTKGVIFYGTPHFGSHIASYSNKARALLFPSVEVLELIENSPKLYQINKFLNSEVESDSIKILSFGEGRKTQFGYGLHLNLHIVPPESADPGTGEFILADCDHFEICKPAQRESDIYQQSLNFIKSAIYENSSDSKDEVIHQGFEEDQLFW